MPREGINVESYPVAYRGLWLWGWYGRELETRRYREGILAIDIFDGASRQPVWHGRTKKEDNEHRRFGSRAGHRKGRKGDPAGVSGARPMGPCCLVRGLS